MHNTIDVYDNINNYKPRKNRKKINVFENMIVEKRETFSRETYRTIHFEN